MLNNTEVYMGCIVFHKLLFLGKYVKLLYSNYNKKTVVYFKKGKTFSNILGQHIMIFAIIKTHTC